MSTQSGINVIVLAETGGQDAKQLVRGVLEPTGWMMKTNNVAKKSGVNDITLFYRSTLARSFDFQVSKLLIGNSAVISCETGRAECRLVGSHILNKKASNKVVGKFLESKGIGAIFGDTNMSTKASSSRSHGFRTIESTTSLTDFSTLTSSNSAGDKMFDKLLVRK